MEKEKSLKMKTGYVTQVENKYVFNVSLIFWHLFIAISTLVVVASLLVFLWSLIPASQKDVEKQSYPEPVKVALTELQLETQKEEAPTQTLEQAQAVSVTNQQPSEDIQGKGEYDASLNTLKTLIPPSKYSWQGSGYWSYPNGDDRYWKYYKLEKYRQWNSTELGLEDKLKSACNRSNATKYPDRKIILDGLINVIKLLPEETRLGALQDLMSNVADNISQNINIYQSLAKIVGKMSQERNIAYINQLVSFGKRNTHDGYIFINYISTIIDKFDASKRIGVIEQLTIGYYNFNQNLSMLKEATDLFLPLVAQIKAENQVKAIMQYYGVFRNKNYARDNAIAQIEYKYNLDQMSAQAEYYSDKVSKAEYRTKSLAGIGGGIVLIVLIAVVLVFFSIQRSVRKIEEKLLTTGGNANTVV